MRRQIGRNERLRTLRQAQGEDLRTLGCAEARRSFPAKDAEGAQVASVGRQRVAESAQGQELVPRRAASGGEPANGEGLVRGLIRMMHLDGLRQREIPRCAMNHLIASVY